MEGAEKGKIITTLQDINNILRQKHVVNNFIRVMWDSGSTNSYTIKSLDYVGEYNPPEMITEVFVTFSTGGRIAVKDEDTLNDLIIKQGLTIREKEEIRKFKI